MVPKGQKVIKMAECRQEGGKRIDDMVKSIEEQKIKVDVVEVPAVMVVMAAFVVITLVS